MNYYNGLKKELIDNKIIKLVKDHSINKSNLNTYYNVGKMLFELSKDSKEEKIKEYSNKLTNDLGKGYSVTNLKRMIRFYLLIDKGVILSYQLSWNHYIELIPIKNIDEINYYITISIKNNLSYKELRQKIKSNEYERLDKEIRNKIIDDNIKY